MMFRANQELAVANMFPEGHTTGFVQAISYIHKPASYRVALNFCGF